MITHVRGFVLNITGRGWRHVGRHVTGWHNEVDTDTMRRFYVYTCICREPSKKERHSYEKVSFNLQITSIANSNLLPDIPNIFLYFTNSYAILLILQNLSHRKESTLRDNVNECRWSHFHINGSARRLVFTQTKRQVSKRSRQSLSNG